MKKLLILVLALVALVGCTENQRARQLGGTMTVKLPCGQKLVNATWKTDHLWYLTRPMDGVENPTKSTFQEDSSWGVLNGTVLFVECK